MLGGRSRSAGSGGGQERVRLSPVWLRDRGLDLAAPALPDVRLADGLAPAASAAVTGSPSELEAWYARRLRPRVVAAARAGAIAPAQAIGLERQMRDLLGAAGDRWRERAGCEAGRASD